MFYGKDVFAGIGCFKQANYKLMKKIKYNKIVGVSF